MKKIDVQKQPILSWAKTTRIALAGVKYRIFRALVTLAVIAVAMAFLMNILTESLLKKSVAESAREGIGEMRRTDKWIAKLSVPQSFSEALATLDSGEAFEADRAFFGDPPEAEREALREEAREAIRYLNFFDRLNYGRRRVLVGSASSTRIFDLLQDPARRTEFSEALANMKTVRFPGSPEDFFVFLGRWEALKGYLTGVREKQRRAIEAVQAALGMRTMLEAMQDAGGAFGQVIRSAGFDLSDAEAASLVNQAERVSDRRLIEDTINHPGLRQAMAARFDVLPGDVTTDMIWSMLRHTGGGEWFLVAMKENGVSPPGRLDAGRLAALSAERSEARLLVRAELMTAETGGGLLGIGPRMTWLAFVSMLVCVVGIANAMLMSVTERFREIATLKCLGALDGFIMTVFLIEASILGFVGGVVGTLLGLLLCFLRMSITFHSLLYQTLPYGPLALASGISVVVGVVLAAVAAVYPSFRAARLAPMEAMRIE